ETLLIAIEVHHVRTVRGGRVKVKPILLLFCSPGNLLFGMLVRLLRGQWFCSLMNVCLLITYFSTNNSIIITRKFATLSQLPLAPAIASQQTPKKYSTFWRKKNPRNQ